MAKRSKLTPSVVFICVLSLFVVAGCESAESTDEEIVQRLMDGLPPVEDLFITQSSSDTDNRLILALHGGPAPVLATEQFQFLETDGLPVAYVRQYQMLEPDCLGLVDVSRQDGGTTPTYVADGVFGGRDAVTTEERSHECFLGSVAVLRKVVLHLQEQNMELDLIAASLGSFISQKYIATYGSSDFGNVVITASRVDMPQEVVNAFNTGSFAEFIGGTQIQVYPPPPDFQDVRGSEVLMFEIEGTMATLHQNSTIAANLSGMRFQASVATERYSVAFEQLDLSNLSYFSGTMDRAVGRLSQAEIDVLERSGATVMLVEADHDLTVAAQDMITIFRS